jgi:quinoprotein glucose dehydrogenase
MFAETAQPVVVRRAAWPPLAAWARIAFWIVASVTGALGLGMAWLGAEIAWLGGTPYYLIGGVLLIGAGGAGFLGRRGAALGLMAAVVALTLTWAMVEIAGKGWHPGWGVDLAGRLGLLAALLAVAIVIEAFGRVADHRLRAPVLGVAGLGLVALVLTLALHWERPEDASVPAISAQAAAAALPPADPALHNDAGEWLSFGGSALGQRFSPAAQVTPENVSELREAWRMRTGDLPPSDRVYYSAQNTPLKIGDALYVCTPSHIVISLDPATGAENWRFDPEAGAEDMESLFSAACRAVGYFEGAEAEADGACAQRVYVTTVDSRLIALDAGTGQICEGFGQDGVVDLAEGMGLREMGFASSTSGPTVLDDVVIVGQQVSDNQRRDAPSGVVRGYDANSGVLLWAWDAHLQGRAQEPLAPGDIYPRGTPNVWNVIGGDPSLGLAYMGTGNSGGDHWGGTRTALEDRFTAAVVAVDYRTGETVWDFATIIHDLWDYDIGAQPVVLDMLIDDQPRRVVMQATKSGSLFVLDAETGQPVRPVAMRPAPQGAAPGDWVNPTQPQSTSYPNFSGAPGWEPEVIDPRHAFGLTPLDAALCRRDFHRMRYEGMFTPPTDDPGGMLLFPGTIGGMNWGGIAIDRERGVVVTNHSRLPNRVVLHPREQVEDQPVGDGGARPDQDVAPQSGTPYGVTRPMWLSPLGVPCIAPPWGYVAATDIQTGELLWSKPLGTGRDAGPLGMPTFLELPMGTANVGGPMVTTTGLTFIAAAQDDYLRAFETATGRLLWRGRLPAGGQASPITYEHQGRQYVVIGAAGHERLETAVGDYVIAFALED